MCIMKLSALGESGEWHKIYFGKILTQTKKIYILDLLLESMEG